MILVSIMAELLEAYTRRWRAAWSACSLPRRRGASCRAGSGSSSSGASPSRPHRLLRRRRRRPTPSSPSPSLPADDLLWSSSFLMAAACCTGRDVILLLFFYTSHSVLVAHRAWISFPFARISSQPAERLRYGCNSSGCKLPVLTSVYMF